MNCSFLDQLSYPRSQCNPLAGLQGGLRVTPLQGGYPETWGMKVGLKKTTVHRLPWEIFDQLYYYYYYLNPRKNDGRKKIEKVYY